MLGWRKVGRRLGLPAEALHEGPVDRELGEQDLEGHRPVEQQVLGQVHLRHTAPGDVADQFVAVVEDAGRGAFGPRGTSRPARLRHRSEPFTPGS